MARGRGERRRGWLRCVAVVGALACLWSVPAAGAATPSNHANWPDLQCGAVSTSVVLREDLTCPNAIFVDDDARLSSITIDLDGHTLTGPGCSSEQCGTIEAGDPFTSVNIEDGTIVGGVTFVIFATPVGGGGIRDVHVEGDLYLSSNWIRLGPGQQVRHDTIDGQVYIIGSNSTVTHNAVGGGIMLDDGPAGMVNTVITDNTVTNAPYGGIAITDFFLRPDISGTIGDNTVMDSGGAGIDLDDGADLAGLVVVRNRLIDNGGDGLHMGTHSWDTFPSTGSVTVMGNLAMGNAGHGYDLEPAVGTTIDDGGRNRAVGNGADPACIGIHCRPVHS